MSEDLINCRGNASPGFRLYPRFSIRNGEREGERGKRGERERRENGWRRTNTRRHNSDQLAGCGRVASDLTGFMENNYLSGALLHSNSARGIRRNFNRGDRF